MFPQFRCPLLRSPLYSKSSNLNTALKLYFSHVQYSCRCTVASNLFLPVKSSDWVMSMQRRTASLQFPSDGFCRPQVYLQHSNLPVTQSKSKTTIIRSLHVSSTVLLLNITGHNTVFISSKNFIRNSIICYISTITDWSKYNKRYSNYCVEFFGD